MLDCHRIPSIQWLGVLLPPAGWDARPLQDAQHKVTRSIYYYPPSPHPFPARLFIAGTWYMVRLALSIYSVAKFFGSAGWNANRTRESTRNFPEQADSLRRYSTFSVSSRWKGICRSICTKFQFLLLTLQTLVSAIKTHCRLCGIHRDTRMRGTNI